MQFVNNRRSALQYPLVHWILCRCQQYGAFSMKALARYQVIYCLVNRGTLCVNNLPRVVTRIMPRSESNLRPLDHESSALTTTPPSLARAFMLMRRNVAAGIGSNEQGEYCRAALQRSDRKEPRYKSATLLTLLYVISLRSQSSLL